MMCRPWACRASQHIVSASSDCTQIILSPLSLSPPTSSLSGKHPVVFTTLVILCFSVLTFSRRDRDYQISSPDPLLPALRLPFLPAVWEDPAGFLSHFKARLRLRLWGLHMCLTAWRSRLLYPEVSLEKSLTSVIQEKRLKFWVSCSLSVCQYLLDL